MGALTSVGAFFIKGEKKMNLNEKPLYALRELGEKLNVPGATKLLKHVLIEKIYERAHEIENGVAVPPKSSKGRPKLKSCFIGVKRDENGKVVFFEAATPEEANMLSDVKPEETAAKSKKEREQEIKRLEESKKIFNSIIAAIDCYIKTLDY